MPVFLHQSQVSLFLSEKISFWTVDCMIGKLSSIFSAAGRGGDDSTTPGHGNPGGSEGLLSGYEGRAIGSKNRANSSGSYLHLRPGGDSSFHWSTGQWECPVSNPILCIDPWSSLSKDVILRGRQSGWSRKGQDSGTVVQQCLTSFLNFFLAHPTSFKNTSLFNITIGFLPYKSKKHLIVNSDCSWRRKPKISRCGRWSTRGRSK